MKRPLILLLLLLASCAAVRANDSARGWCEEGNRPVVTSGLNSTTRVQASHPSCIITVNVHGDGLATIYSDNNLTPLANPFTSQSDGQWQFYAANGRYDVTMSSAGFSQTITYSDILLCDPFAVGSTCNNGGTSQAHNLLSTTHLDTIPASPPVRGDVITAQNQTSPTSVNPSWARLPLGTAGQVLLSNGLDALWGNLVAGSGITITNTGSPAGSTVTIASSGGGCTLPGVTDTAVVTEHPVTTCFDSANWTWNDGSNKQNMQQGLTNTVGSVAALTFQWGQSNGLCGIGTTCSEIYVQGNGNDIETVSAGGSSGDAFNFNWIAGRNNQMAGNIRDSYIIGGDSTAGESNIFDTNSTGTIRNAMCLLAGCARNGGGVNAVNGADVSKVFLAGDSGFVNGNGTSLLMGQIYAVGAFNTYTASGTSGLLSSVFTFGESDTVSSTNGCQLQDFYHLGQFSSVTCSNASGFLLKNYTVGYLNNFTTNNAATNSINASVGSSIAMTNCSHHYMFGEAGTCSGSATATSTLGVSAVPEVVTTSGHIALAGHLDQSATGKFAGSCAMGAATTCTFSIAAAYTGTPLCVTSIDAASSVPATANVAKCSVSGTTVTITAGISNSLTWDAILVGNPN
jgi:hypothetical protein